MNTNLEEIKKFQSMNELVNFEKWIARQVNDRAATEVSVRDYYIGPNSKERWFEFESISQTWRLVYPDGPFSGYWGMVDI